MTPKLTSSPITTIGSVLAGLICLASAAYQITTIVTETRVDSEPTLAAATPSDWKKLPNIEHARFESTAIQYQDDIYVFNGFGKGIKVEPTVEKFDAKKLNWSVVSKTSVAKGNAVTHNGFVVHENEVWIIGGRLGDHPGAVTSKVWKFNLDTLDWSAGPKLPVPGAAGGAALVDDRIHWFGGIDTQARCDVDNHYVYDLNNPSAGWSDISSVAPMPIPRNHFATVVLDELIYAIGGQFTHDGCGAGTPDTNLSHVFDPKTNTWDQIDNLPAVQSHIEPSTFVHKGAIYVVGGATKGTKVYRYDPSRDRWQTVAELPQALLAPIARVVNDELVVSSGGAPATIPSAATYKTDMTPLLLPGAQNTQTTDEPESATPVADTTDIVPEENETVDEVIVSSNEGDDIADDPVEVEPEQDENIDPPETPQVSNESTDAPADETNQSTSVSQTDIQDDTTAGGSIEADVPDRPQNNTINNCDYSDAHYNDGWGWDPVTQTSCSPLPVVDTQSESPEPSREVDTETTVEQNTIDGQTLAEEQAPDSESGGGSTDKWMIILLWSLIAIRLSYYRRTGDIVRSPHS